MIMSKYPEFARRFQNLCREANAPTKQKELGDYLGITGPYAYYLRNGAKLPSIDMAIKLCKSNKLDCCVEYLLTGKGPKKPVSQKQLNDLQAVFASLSSKGKKEIIIYAGYISERERDPVKRR